jgi:poly-gamma-glutamate capsule biosynthesis protein CapA/YwtB (metallophosphatase superfamily)
VKRLPRRAALAVVAVFAAAAIVTLLAAAIASRHAQPVTGRVIDLHGQPIAGATVAMGSRSTTTGADGTFRLNDPAGEGWIRATAPGFLPRLRPTGPGREVLMRLTPDDGQTISLVFGGDVMFGRRYFDPNEDGDTRDGQLRIDSTASEEESLLAGARPPLEAADLAVVNLETPLLANPYVDPTEPRPAAFHPAKEFVFASNPASARALADVGVDIVGLGNNHLYDALDDGVRETLAALDGAGFVAGSRRTGGGLNDEAAWAPALASVRGVEVAVLACTTITGEETPPLYVAAPTRAGAAECTEPAITQAVTAARAQASIVVVMIHGGFEYERTPSEHIQQLSRVAHAAGATLVVNSHPHVIGGFHSDQSGLTAWSMGNLLFDQLVWPTFESYLLTVDIRAGRPIRAIVDPLMIDDFRPQPIVGDLALHVARDAAGFDPGQFVVEDGTLEIDDPALVTSQARSVSEAGPPEGAIFHLGGSTRLEGTNLGDQVEAGRDLLWTGGFEDEEMDGAGSIGSLWLPPTRGREFIGDAAAVGKVGARLERTGGNVDEVVLSPTHRVPVTAGSQLTLLARYRGVAAGSRIQLSWYNDLKGESLTQTLVELPPNDAWQLARIDVKVPLNAVAVLPLIRLGPPTAGRVALDVDEVQLIEWRPASDATLATDYLRVRGTAALSIAAESLAGPGADAPLPEPSELPVDVMFAPPAASDLPPGPDESNSEGD